MKQVLGFFVLIGIFFSGCAKKSPEKKMNQKDTKSYIVIQDHRARGIHKKAQKGLFERKEHAHKKRHHVKKAREEYYKKHTSRGVKINIQK